MRTEGLSLRDMLSTDGHRTMLVILETDARGRAKSITTDALRQRMLKEYGVEVADRDMRQIRSDLCARGWPCYPGPSGYYYGIEPADLHDARTYIGKKAMPLLKERNEMKYAFEAELRRNELAPRMQMEMDLKVERNVGRGEYAGPYRRNAGGVPEPGHYARRAPDVDR